MQRPSVDRAGLGAGIRRPRLDRATLVAGAFLALLFAAATAVVLTMQAVSVPPLPPPTFSPDKPGTPGSLKHVTVPLPANLGDFVVDRQAAIVLGKALYWDAQAGSDGMACASCHFLAGADNRVKNQLNPGFQIRSGAAGIRALDATGAPRPEPGRLSAAATINETFDPTATGGGGPNYALKKADFPFHKLSDPEDRNSTVLFDSNDVVSSAGVFPRSYTSLSPAPKRGDEGVPQTSLFSVGGVNVRNVEPRNAPTTINAVFYFVNFWDGRANNVFNGRNPFGPRDPTAGVDPRNSVLVADGEGNLTPFKVAIPDASLASQAVGPALSDLEMSYAGRTFEEVGQKLLRRQPLAGQRVDPADSVLGPYASTQGGKDATGLTITYEELIRRAFQPRFWSSDQLTEEGYTQREKNFSLFWGLSIMLYEATLVSDDSPFDRYMDGDITAMTSEQVNGFVRVFMDKGGCIFCHRGPEFSSAATALRFERLEGGAIEQMPMGDGTIALYDSGFYNIAARPSREDLGAGGTDPWGNPLSITRQATSAAQAGEITKAVGVGVDRVEIATCTFIMVPCTPIVGGARDAMDGAFKTPTLRNVELTGPYLHNGGEATLRSVMEFYDRGGDHRGTDAANTTGYGPNPTNLAPDIKPLGLTEQDISDLVEFMKALTDERVRWEKAPFDHPELRIPNGHPGDQAAVLRDVGSLQAADEYIVIPAVGAAGRAAKGLPPVVPFDEGLQ